MASSTDVDRRLHAARADVLASRAYKMSFILLYILSRTPSALITWKNDTVTY